MKDFSTRFNYYLTTVPFGTTIYCILRGEMGEEGFIQSQVYSIDNAEDPLGNDMVIVRAS